MVDWPVGTPEERAAATNGLPGAWFDANPYMNQYQFGFHTGADLNLNKPIFNADKGKPAYAIADGVVTFSGEGAGHTWGWLVIIEYTRNDGSKFYTRTAHDNEQQFVPPKAGDTVKQGQQIGAVGNADGYYANGGDHQHFDVSHTDVLLKNPSHWPGNDASGVLLNYLAPIPFIIQMKKAWPVIQPQLATLTGTVNIRSQPVVTSSRMGQLPAGAPVTIDMGRLADPYVYCPAVGGWILYSACDTGLPKSVVRYTSVTTSLNVRAEGSPAAPIRGKLYPGQEVVVSALPNANGYVEWLNGTGWWMSAQWLTDTAPHVTGYDIYHDNNVDILKLAGVAKFIAHKASQGATYTDPLYLQRRAAASGTKWIATHFCTGEPIADQLANFEKSAQFNGNTLPALDVEHNPIAAQGDISGQQLIDLATAVHAKLGIWPIIYSRANWLAGLNIGTSATLANCPLWLATAEVPVVVPAPWLQWDFVQYAQSQPDGASALIDTDKFNGTPEYFDAWWVARFPTVPPAPPTVPISKVGIHYMPGGNNIKLLTLLQVCATAGKPIPGVKLVKMGGGFSNGLQVADVKLVSPTTKVCVRPLFDDWENRAKQIDWINGDHYAQGMAFAQEYINRFANGDNLLADYHQIICEPPAADGAIWAVFWSGVLDCIANSPIKIKVAIGCFGVFHPPLPGENDHGVVRPFDQFWKTPAVLALLNRAQREGHVLLLDEYQYPDPAGSWTDANSILRHQQVYALLPQGLKHLPLWLGELGTAFGAKMSNGEYKSRVVAWDAAVKHDDYLVSGCLWTFGGGGAWQDSLLDGRSDTIQDYLLHYS